MIRNLSYSTTEDDLESLFEPFGTLNELNLIIDESTMKNKGFGFITYTFPENAVEAYEHLDGMDFQGRLIHLIPAKEAKGNTSGMLPEAKAKLLSSFKKKKLEKQLQKDGEIGGKTDDTNNPAYITPTIVSDKLANEYEVTKSSVALDLDEDNKNNLSAAVRLAIGESMVTKDLQTTKEKERSRKALVIKNIPIGIDEKSFREFFISFGNIIDFSYQNPIATIEFEMARAAKRAAKSIRLKTDNPFGKGPPLLVEWASKNWNQEIKDEVQQKSENEAFYPTLDDLNKKEIKEEN